MDSFGWAVKLLYQHGLARRRVENNKPHTDMGKKKKGEMYAIGSRGGSDPGLSGGPYVLNERTRKRPDLMVADIKRMLLMPAIEKFTSSLFHALASVKHAANLAIGQACGVSWASANFLNELKLCSIGSNLVITRDEFVNAPHEDDDATDNAIGFFCLMERDSGNLLLPDDSRPFQIHNSIFRFPEYNINVKLGHFPKIIVWNTKVRHHSTESQTRCHPSRKLCTPKAANLTNFGSSIQIPKSMLNRVNKVEAARGNMTEAEFKAYQASRFRTYSQEIQSRISELLEANKMPQADKDLIDSLLARLHQL